MGNSIGRTFDLRRSVDGPNGALRNRPSFANQHTNLEPFSGTLTASDQMDVIYEETEVAEEARQNLNDFEEKKADEIGFNSTKD